MQLGYFLGTRGALCVHQIRWLAPDSFNCWSPPLQKTPVPLLIASYSLSTLRYKKRNDIGKLFRFGEIKRRTTIGKFCVDVGAVGQE